MCYVHACMCVHICVPVVFPRTRVTNDCKPPCWCWGSNLVPSQDQQVLLRAQLSLQPHLVSFLRRPDQVFVPYMLSSVRVSRFTALGLE